MVKRSLINYLPIFIQEYAEIRQIMFAEQGLIDGIWETADHIQDNQFINYTDEDGIKRWENMLKITAKDTDTLEERRFRILTRFQSDTPYTVAKLDEKLTTLCGEGNFHIILTPNDYTIDVKLALGNASMLSDVEEIVNNMIPANMIRNIIIMYNTHALWSAYTHEQMSAYTHEQLRNEVIPNA